MIGEPIYASHRSDFRLVYVSIFLLSFHLFFVVYMNSSFLSTFVEERFVGLVYMISAAVSIPVLLYITKLLRLIGNYRTLFYFAIIELLIFIGFATLDSAYLIIPLYVLQSTIFPVMMFNFDIFLESYTTEESKTGSIRGVTLSLINAALILGPLIAGFVLTNGDYWKIYLIAAFILIPFLGIIQKFRHFKDPKYHDMEVWGTLKCIINHKDLSNIIMTQFLMRFMFAWMVIYAPIYLHAHIGFSWAEIGVMTAILLTPFMVLEYPVGKLADKIGEKKLLMLGFLIAGLFIFLLSLTTAKDFLYWSLLMLMTRVGASFIEILSESYFFRHVDGSDNNTISLFRITRPLAYVAGPLVGSLALFFVDIQYIWIILGFVMLSGIYFSHNIGRLYLTYK